MRRRPRKDRNHPQIVNALRDVGYTVQDLAGVADGCPDILVGGIDRRTGVRRDWPVEIKMPGEPLTDDQEVWHATWGGTVYIVESVDDAYRLVGVLP